MKINREDRQLNDKMVTAERKMGAAYQGTEQTKALSLVLALFSFCQTCPRFFIVPVLKYCHLNMYYTP